MIQGHYFLDILKALVYNNNTNAISLIVCSDLSFHMTCLKLTKVAMAYHKAQYLDLFSSHYTTPLSSLISSLSLNRRLYADDTQLFTSLQPGNFAENISRLHAALGSIADWKWMILNLCLKVQRLNFSYSVLSLS